LLSASSLLFAIDARGGAAAALDPAVSRGGIFFAPAALW
jgi:hypothetical protein